MNYSLFARSNPTFPYFNLPPLYSTDLDEIEEDFVCSSACLGYTYIQRPPSLLVKLPCSHHFPAHPFLLLFPLTLRETRGICDSVAMMYTPPLTWYGRRAFLFPFLSVKIKISIHKQ